MAKLSRNQLKSLIKECLVEVLVEGLSSSSSTVSLQEEVAPTKKKLKPSPRRRSPLDNVKFNQKLEESVSQCTSDPVLGNILADTARTTLQEQIGEEMGHGHQVAANGDQAAKMASSADPLDMFGDAANNWAALAFNKV